MVKIVKAWQVAILVVVAIIISIIVAIEQGIPITPYYFLPLVIVIAVSFGLYFLFTKVLFKKKPVVTIGKLSIEEVRYLAALHLLKNHGIDLFANGPPEDPKTAKYIVHLIANRSFPSPAEEVWFVRTSVKDSRYFDGLFTRIIIFVDGESRVTDDFIMNERTVIDAELWRHPETWLIKSPSKTFKPKSIPQIMAQRYEETGEFPNLPKEEKPEED